MCQIILLNKKDLYHELVEKVNVIDTSKHFSKTDYNAEIKDIEDKIPSITNLVTNGENKIPSISNLVKKADYDAKKKTLTVNILPHLIIINLQIR